MTRNDGNPIVVNRMRLTAGDMLALASMYPPKVAAAGGSHPSSGLCGPARSPACSRPPGSDLAIPGLPWHRQAMVSVRGCVCAGLVVVATAGTLSAQPAPRAPVAPNAPNAPKPTAPALVGAAEVIKVTAPGGFIDDGVASDGTRLAYVVADAAAKAELRVVTLATRAEQVINLSPVTLHPIALQLVGARLLVVGRLEDGRQLAALVELADKGKGRPAGTAVYKVAPATHITILPRGVAVHRAAPSKTGTRHDVELLALDSGRRVDALRTLELDAASHHKQLDFRVNHWSDGWTRAHGIKGGDWDPKENQRTPDAEATYDLLTGKLAGKKPIADLVEQRRRFAALAGADVDGRGDFVRVNWDTTGLHLWRAGAPRVLELDQPFAAYDPKSFQSIIQPDGSAWIAAKIDPVNAEAVARKKADVEYFDVFHAPPEGKATRKARVLAQGTRYRFGVFGDKFWLLERNQGFDRGGKSLAVYQLQ